METCSSYLMHSGVLVLSNLAMAPAIRVSYLHNRPALVAILTLMMFVSMLYHLCDMQIFCIKISFQDIQNFDYLCSCISIGSVLTYYGDTSESFHAALIISFLSLYLPITMDISNLTTAVITVVISGGVIVVSWRYRRTWRNSRRAP